MQRQPNMQQVEAAHGQQQFECRAPRGIFYNGTWYNTEALQLPSCVLPETQWQQQQQQQQQQYAHATLQPGLHLQQGLQLVVAEVSPQLPLQSSRSHHQLCSCERGQPLSMLHGQCTHQCNYEAVIEQQQQHLQQLTAQHIQTPLMQPLPQQFHQELQQQVDQQQQPQYFIQQQLELTHLNQQQQWCYSTQVQATDSLQQEIQHELPQQELQLQQQQQQHFIQQQHSYQQQLPQQQLQLELQQQQHFMQTQLESHQQHQENSNQQQLLQHQQQYCYSAQKEIQQQLPQQQLESQELQQHEQHLNQQQQCCYSTQVQATDSPQQEIQQELPQQELQLQQQPQQHFIHQQHSYQQQHFQQQLPQQQLQLELQQQQHFMQTHLESHQLHQQHQPNSNQQQLQQQYCYSAQKEIQQQLTQQQLESQELQQHEQLTNQQEQQQCCYSTQFQQQQQQLQQQLEHQTQSQQQLQQAQLQQQQQQQQDFMQQQLESQQLQQHQQDSNEQQQLEQCCYSTQVEPPQKEMQQQLPQLQFESQQLQQHSNEQQEQKDSEQCCYLTQVQDTQSPQQQMQQKLQHQAPAEQQFQQQPHFVQQQLDSQQLQQHQQQQCCHSTQLEQQLPQQLQQPHPQQQQQQQQQPRICQQQQQPLICQQHYLPDQTNNYRPQSSSTTPTSFPSSPSSILTPQPVNDPKIIELDMSSLSKVHITRTFGRLVISIYRQTELDDESPNRVIINGQVLSSDDSSNGQSMRQLYVNSATQTPTEEEIQTETSMSTGASDEADSSTADLEELLQYTTAAVATVNQSKSNVQTEPEQFRAPRRVAKQQHSMLQHNPLKKAPKWTQPAKRIAREFQNSPESNKTLFNLIQQENEQMPQENPEGILKKIEVVNSETIQVLMLQKESSTNLQKVEQMQQQESGRVLRKIEQVQMPQKRSERIIQKIEQVQLSEKKSTTNLHKIKEKEMLQEHNSNTILKKIEKTNLQKIEQIPIQQKDSGRILQKIDAVGVPQKEPRTNLNNIKEKQMTQKKPETILQKIEQMPLLQNESTTNVQKIGQIQQEKSGIVLQKIDVVQMPQEKPTTDKVKTKSDSDSNNLDNLIKQTALGIGGSQQPQLALGQQDREEEWPELSVQQATPSARLRKSQSSPQPIVNQKCNGTRSPPSFPDDYPIGEPKLPQSIFKQMYKRKSSQSKTIEQSTKQETPPLRSQSVDNVKRSLNIKTYQRINHNSEECPQSNAIRQIRSPTRKYQSAQSSQSLVNQQKNLTRCQQGATKPITMKCQSKAQLIAVHQSDVNQATTRNDQVVNQPKSSSNQASIQSGNQKHKSTPKAMSKEKSEQQSNVNQTVNLKSPSVPRFGLDESKTSKAITDQPKKKSNGAFESNANQATDAKESEGHQSMNLSAGNEKPCSESVNQPEVSLNPEMDNDTKPSTSQNVEALVIRKTNNGRKQKTPMSKFERKALRRELQNVQLAARKSEENSQTTEEVLQPVEVQHDVEEVKRNQQSTEVDQHLKDIPQPMELESFDEIKPKEEPKETEPSDEDPELNNPLLSGVSCKIMRGHILRIAKKINSL